MAAWAVTVVPEEHAFAAEILVGEAGCTLPDAVAAAETNTAVGGCPAGDDIGDTVLVPPGAHTLSSPEARAGCASPSATALCVITSSVTVRATDPTVGATIVRDAGAPGMRFFLVNGGELVLENLTLEGGTAVSVGGGAIALQNARLWIRGTTFRGNRASRGGAIYAWSSTLELSNDNLFESNEATNDGGAIYVSFTGLVIGGTAHFASNRARQGGAVWITDTSGGATANVDGAFFADNAATEHGGAAYVGGGVTAGFTNCRFERNRAVGDGGGAVSVVLSSGPTTTTFEDNVFRGNEASHRAGGGAILLDAPGVAATATIARCTFDENRVIGTSAVRSVGGGALRVNGFDTVSIEDTAFRSNRAFVDVTFDPAAASIREAGCGSLTLSIGASSSGSAIDAIGAGSVALTRSCVVGQLPAAVVGTPEGPANVTADGNWWGSADGPGGEGAGAGDHIGTGVTVGPVSAPVGTCDSGAPAPASLTLTPVLSGDADANDFEANPGPLALVAPGGQAILEVTAFEDGEEEGDETVLVGLEAGTEPVRLPAPAEITIVDDGATAVSVATPDPEAAEGEPPDAGRLQLQRTGCVDGPLDVCFAVRADSPRAAQEGLDYEPLPGREIDGDGCSARVVSLPAGEPSFNFHVVPIDDGIIEGDELVTVEVILFDERPRYTVGGVRRGTVTIADDDGLRLDKRVVGVRGLEVEYLLRAWVHAADPIDDVQLEDVSLLAGGARLVSVRGPAPGTCTPEVRCSLGTLRPGEAPAEVRLVVEALSAGELTNVARLSAPSAPAVEASATVELVAADAGPAGDAGTSPPGDGGCGCTAGPGSSPAGGLALLLLFLLRGRRGRRPQ